MTRLLTPAIEMISSLHQNHVVLSINYYIAPLSPGSLVAQACYVHQLSAPYRDYSIIQ